MSDQMFVVRSRNVFMASDRGDEVPVIPTGTYSVQYNPMAGGFFLQRIADMELPTKLYGTTLPRADQILNTFKSRDNRTTGVLLSGNKGSGKTLLAKTLAAKVLESDIPVLVLQQAYAGPEFEAFLNSIEQPIMIFIDEFEKKYDEPEKQNQLLSLLDGYGRGSKLYALTSNSADVSEFLLNRPSRIFYHFSYKKLEEDVLVGYCADNLHNQKRFNSIRALWNLSKDMSFDILQSVVEESNRYPDKQFISILDDMNVSLNGQLMRRYRLKRVLCNGERVPCSETGSANVHLVYFQDGDMQVAAQLRIPFSQQVPLVEKMKSDEYFWYNGQEYEEMQKEGKVYHDEDTCDEFTLRLRWVEGQTFLSTERLSFTRTWGNQNFEIVFESDATDPTFSAIAKVFEGLEG